MSIREITESVLKFIREQDEVQIPPQQAGGVAAQAQADDAGSDNMFKPSADAPAKAPKAKDSDENEPSDDTEEEQEFEKEVEEKEYLGTKGSDEFFYLFRKINDAGEIEDLQVIDAGDEELLSAVAQGIPLDDVKAFVLKAIDELEMSMIAFEIVMNYIFPDEEDEDYVDDEKKLADKNAEDLEAKNRAPGSAPAGSALSQPSIQGERIPPAYGGNHTVESKRAITNIYFAKIGERVDGVSTFIYAVGKGAGQWAQENAEKWGLDFEDPEEYSVTLIGADEIANLPDLLDVLRDERFVTDVVQESDITHFNLPHGEASETIKQVGSKYRVVSRKGRNLGTYDTQREAKKRLRHIEFFKDQREGYAYGKQPADAKAAGKVMNKSKRRNRQTNRRRKNA